MANKPLNNFSIWLASNASLDTYPSNKPQEFRNKLSQPLDLNEDNWTMSLSEITYPNNYHLNYPVNFDFTLKFDLELRGSLKETKIIDIKLENASVTAFDNIPGLIFNLNNKISAALAPFFQRNLYVYYVPKVDNPILYGEKPPVIEATIQNKRKRNINVQIEDQSIDMESGSVINTNDADTQPESIASASNEGVEQINEKLESPDSQNVKTASSSKNYIELRLKPYEILNFIFNQNLNRISMQTVLRDGVLFTINNNETKRFFEYLGLSNLNYNENNRSTRIKRFVAKNNPYRIAQHPSLFIYCDKAEYSMVGDTQAPILLTIPSKIPINNEIILEKPWRLTRIPIKKGYINDMEIAIKDDKGNPILFKEGIVFLTIEFQKIKQ